MHSIFSKPHTMYWGHRKKKNGLGRCHPRGCSLWGRQTDLAYIIIVVCHVSTRWYIPRRRRADSEEVWWGPVWSGGQGKHPQWNSYWDGQKSWEQMGEGGASQAEEQSPRRLWVGTAGIWENDERLELRESLGRWVGGMKLEWGPGVWCAMVRIWSSSEWQVGGCDKLVFLRLRLAIAQFLD